MSKYESSIKVVKSTVESVFEKLTDFSRLKGLVPQEYVKDFRVDGDACHFTIDKAGEICLKIVEKTPYSLVKYGLEASVPVDVNLFVQLKPSPDTDAESRLKVTLMAEIPLMLRPMIGNKLQEAVDKIADALARQM